MQNMKKCVFDMGTMIAKMQKELMLKRQEEQSHCAELKAERSRCQTFESRVLNTESINAALKKQLAENQNYSRYIKQFHHSILCFV